MSKHAIVIDDTPANQDFLTRLISQAQFETRGLGSGQAALDVLYGGDTPIDLAIVDMELPDMNGLQLALRIRERHPDAFIIIATMHDAPSLMTKAFEAGVNVFLVKPHGFMELYRRLVGHSLADLATQGPTLIDQHGPRPFQFPAVH